MKTPFRPTPWIEHVFQPRRSGGAGILLPDLIAWYDHENTNDSHVYARHATNNGGVTFAAAGKVNNGGTYAGAPYLSQADAAFARTGALTISCWVKLAAKPGNMGLVDRYDGGALSGYTLFYDAGSDRFQWWIANGTIIAACAGTIAPVLGTWYHLVGRWNGSNTLYLHENAGSPHLQNQPITGLAVGSNDFQLGASGGGSPLDGVLDLVGVWGRDIGVVGVNRLYNNPKAYPP